MKDDGERKGPNSGEGLSERYAQDTFLTLVQVDEVFKESKLLVDIYAPAVGSGFELIYKQGSSFDSCLLIKEKEKPCTIYAHIKDRSVIIKQCLYKFSVALTSNHVTHSQKLHSLKNLCEKFSDEVQEFGLNDEMVETGIKISQFMCQLIKKERNIAEDLKPFSKQHLNANSHYFFITFFSIVIVQNLDWNSERTMETVAMGALFHNVGATKNKAMDGTDKTYPATSEEALRGFPIVPQAVRQIVYQHRENIDRTGFPNQISGLLIYPLAKVVALGYGFTQLFIKHECRHTPALKEFLNSKTDIIKYDSSIIKALVGGLIKK